MPTLSELTRFYLDYQRTYNRPGTVESNRYTCEAIERFWGANRDPSSLTLRDLTAFINYRRKTGRPSSHSINSDLRNLRALLNYGVSIGLLTALPFKVRTLRVPVKRQIPLLTPGQIQTLLKLAPYPYRQIILVASQTGMRLSEILYLTWRDVIPDERRITVTAKDGWEPKSHQERSVPATDKLLAMFATLREESEDTRPDAYIFPDRHGNARRGTSASHELSKLWKRAGLYRKGVPILHHLRHTAASRMLHAGASLETVRVILGHSSIVTTSLYVHSDERARREAIDTLESVI